MRDSVNDVYNQHKYADGYENSDDDCSFGFSWCHAFSPSLNILMVDLMIAFAGLATAKQMNVMMEKLMINAIVVTLFLFFL